MALSGPASLARERSGASFNTRELTYLLDGGKEQTELKERMGALVQADPVFRKDDQVFNDRIKQFERALGKLVKAVRMRSDMSLSPEEWTALIHNIDEDVPFGVHFSMFIPHIESQGTDEQQAKWLPLARACSIIGCYAQTEMGHGSNVQGLETTATYDKSREEFVINTPGITGMKWWPGGLGTCATHCVAHARLIIDGKDYGVHAFFMQIRDLDNHNPLPGITVGQIGPKVGYQTVDNGFLRFDNYRIPRFNMLARYTAVAPDGTYSRAKVNPRVAYITMLKIRVSILLFSSNSLARACTVNVRYSAVRRQFARLTDVETQVLDYQMQQYRILPLLAAAIGFRFQAYAVKDMYTQILADLAESNDLAGLPELHATVAGLKAYTTWTAKNGVEECREACGGHGYSSFSGLDQVFRNFSPACTYEGDNVVLCLQTSRYLIKSISKSRSGKAVKGTCAYLANKPLPCTASSVDDFLRPEVYLAACEQRARSLVFRTATNLQDLLKRGVEERVANNEVMVDSVAAVQAHCEYTVASTFVRTNETVSDRSLRAVLERLAALYVLVALEKNSGDLLEDGYFTPDQIKLVRAAVRVLLTELRPDAVALVDSFNISDHVLNSSLGRYDGDVYEHMYEWAKRDPHNNGSKVGYEEYLRPLLRGDYKIRARL